ncbi:unnamed protein product [Rhizoctonia solani]|uniref:PNPLA domain-containing protein n=1 Tax=Rhizoctonia solani TaxID=456999 RepID=A0A8H3GFL5_9AGAM|nr:unnamed protein product [Rhizoctonia solani]
MSVISNGTWIYVDDRRPDRQESKRDLKATATRRPHGIPVSPEELDQQQELLDFYKQSNQRKHEQNNEVKGSSQQTGITHSRLLRHLQSMPSLTPKRNGHCRNITVSSTGATVGPCCPEGQTPAPPPVSSRRRKETSILQVSLVPPVPGAPWAPFRSATDPLPPSLHSRPSWGLLNVNTIVDHTQSPSPSMPTPVLGPHSAISSSPPLLPLSSLPSGYDFELARFRPDANKLRPLRLLSLDGGGVRGISSLRILKNIMDRIKPGARPCDYFDLIAGTSTGGLIAIMLGRLRMSVDECILHYHRLAKHIFKRNSAVQAGSLALAEHRFSPDNLEEAIKDVVAGLTPSNTKMADHHGRCARTFVLAVRKHNLNNHAARRIRSYATQHQPADTCEIWEAGRATSAAPSYFPPIKLKDEHGQVRSYIDGGLGYNNPGKELLNEARDVFGHEHTIGCFLSIGTGRDKNAGFQDVRKLNSAYQAFKAVALSSEQAHHELEEYFSRAPGVYFRFNAGARLVGVDGDEDFAAQVALEDWHKMGQIEKLTSQYLGEEETKRRVKRCAERLNRIALKRIQEWRRTVSHLTVWVTDDRAYYQQARPEIVSLLEAVFDSVRAVDTVRSQIPGPNWVRASEKEFESLLQDYIKLIEIAFPPHRQSRYNTPGDQDALNRGRILYNGLYSFKRRLDEVRGVQVEQRRASAPQLQQNSVPQQQNPAPIPSNSQNIQAPPRAASQGHIEHPILQNGASAPTMRPYTQPVNIARTNSLPTGGVAPMRPTIVPNHATPHLVNGTQQLPQSPQSSIAPQIQAQVTAQSTPIQQPPPPLVAQPVVGEAAPDVAPEGQDWDLEINWDELEALDRSEWQDDASMRVEDHNTSLDPTPTVAETAKEQPETLAEPSSITAPRTEPASTNERGTLIEKVVAESPRRSPSVQPKVNTSDVPESKAEDSAIQKPHASPGHEPAEPSEALDRPNSLVEDIIDIDELPGEEGMADPGHPQTQQQSPTEPVSSTLDEDVINIQYSDDEMEVDELDPSEPPESIRQSEQPEDGPAILSTQPQQSKSNTPQPSTTVQPTPIPNQQSMNDLNSLPPHIRAEIRQKAKGPLIAHYLSISSETREAAEARFQEMSDQEVFDLYHKMEHPRRIVDHHKNALVQSSHKIHLPHIDVREPPPEPPTLLCSVNGAMRLSSETVEFSISAATIASLERWRARFVTPAGSHGELVTVELACYSKNALRPSEGKGRRELIPNAQTRTWPDGGILWAFINSEDEIKDRNVRLFLSPPPFVELNQPVDISDFIREGHNTVKFVHLGGMEHFTFAVQTRRMPPPHSTWPGVLKRIQSLDPSANGYSALINRISVMLEQS